MIDSDSGSEQKLQRLRRLASLLDSSVPLPGGMRMGIDGIIGLLPGVGDGVGALLSSYFIWQAARLGAPKTLLIRMGWNVLLETVIGSVPLFGDIFDIAFKANLRNLALLERYLDGKDR